MQIYINKNGKQLGPFDEKKIVEMLQNGEFSPTDFGINEGEQNWQTLENLFPKVATSVPVSSVPISNDQSSPKKGNGCFKFVGMGMILLSIVLLVGGLGNYGMRKFDNYPCDLAETKRKEADEAFKKIPKEVSEMSEEEAKGKVFGDDRTKLEDWQSKSKIAATWSSSCSELKAARSFWITVTIAIAVFSVLMGIIGIAIVFFSRRKNA